MLEKDSIHKKLAALVLAAGVVLALQIGQSATQAFGESGYDEFGIKKIYQTKEGGEEWYVNMNNPQNDPRFRNIENIDFSKNADGSWRVYADQIRMEAWSPENKKWQNVEITEYAKIESGSNELLQLYSRGGHHTSRDECLGSAYKARLYGDGTAAWNKEITHPSYAGNRGERQATTEPLLDRWVGFKAVIYNIEQNGETYVRLESYIDDNVTDENGNLVVRNNWKLASVYEDRGGWSTSDNDFDSSCGRDRDEILTRPGGTAAQNIAAFRTDKISWSFKYLSVREIEVKDSEDGQTEEPVATPPSEPVPTNEVLDCSTCTIVAGQHVPNSDGTISVINSVDLHLRNIGATGEVMVAIVQNNRVLASNAISADDIEDAYTSVSVPFSAVTVAGRNFDIVILLDGKGAIGTDLDPDFMPGNYFDAEQELTEQDLDVDIR